MSQFKSRKHKAATSVAESGRAQAFSFGEPELVTRSEIMDLFRCELSGEWWVPPVSLEALSKAFRASVYHSSPIHAKVNILVSLFNPHPKLSASDFERFILDYFVYANAYLERVRNRLGGDLYLKPMPAKFMRRGKDLSKFFYLSRDFSNDWTLGATEGARDYPARDVLYMAKPDINQEIYGVPEYLSALPSAWLNNEATLFRLRYYRNGSHAFQLVLISQ